MDHFRSKENDGLIFTPEVGTIKTGTQSDLFKWKPPHMHTVDLWLRSEPAKNPDPSEFEDFEPDPDPDHLYLYLHCVTNQHGGTPLYVAKVRKDASMQEGRIVECTFEIQDPVPLIRKIEPIPDHGMQARPGVHLQLLRFFHSPTGQNTIRIHSNREDKSLPNSVRTAARTLLNRIEAIQLDEIVHVCKK